MATAGTLHVDLSANSAKFDSDLAKARGSLDRFGSGLNRIGGLAGKAGEDMARGLKRSVNDFRELGDAMGLAGGKMGKLGATIADFALTGFSPLSIAIAGAGFLIGELTSKTRESTKALSEMEAQSKRNADELIRMFDELQDFESGTNLSGLRALQREVDAAEATVKRVGGSWTAATNAAGDFVDIEGNVLELTQEQWTAMRLLAQAREKLALATARIAAEEKKRQKAEQSAAYQKQKAADEAAFAKTIADSLAALKKYNDELERKNALEPKQETREEAFARIGAAARAERDAARELSQMPIDDWRDGIKGFQKDFKDLADNDPAKVTAAFREMGETLETSTTPAMTRNSEAVLVQQRAYHGFNEEIARMSEEMRHTDLAGVQLAHTLTEGVGAHGADAFIDIAKGSKSAKRAIGDFASSVVEDLARVILQAYITRAALTAIGFAPGAAAPIPVGAGISGSQSVTQAPTYGNNISDTLFQKSATKVEIHNYGGSRVRVQEDMGADGMKRLKVFVEDTAAESVTKGGAVSRAMRDAFGLGRAPARR